MDEDRRDRYRDKIFWILDRMDLIETWLDEISPEIPISDIKTLLAIFKAFQEVVEATMDFIAMYLRDSGIPSRDDYSNIDRIDLFSIDQKGTIRAMNGMRNRIMHRYNGTDELLALTGISRSMTTIRAIVGVMEQWISKQ
jgi:uncharacterized protein YutE (UPF0331/DUF86 family)